MREPTETLVPRMQNRLYRAAFSVCRDRQEAENITQDVFLLYHHSAKEFESRDHLDAWLLRAAINRAKDVCRSFWRRNRQSLEEIADPIPFETREDRGVFLAVMGLKEKQRIPIYLFYYEDRSIQDIARVLRLPENTVKSRLRRGRMELKTILQEDWRDDEP